LGPRGQADTSLSIEDLRSCDDQQPEFRNLSEFYIINFLNKLKIVENNTKQTRMKNENRMSMSVYIAIVNFGFPVFYIILYVI